jgi:branched-chain amino acid aminotransferase
MPRADVWWDGAIVSWDEPRASPLCHGVQRGAVVFDVGRLRQEASSGDGTTGGDGAGGARRVLFRPDEHIARFLRSAALVGLTVPWDATTLLEATVQVARRAPRSPAALVRWTGFVPSVESDVVPHRSARASVVIAVIAPEDSAPPGGPPPARPAAARVQVPRDARKAGPEVFPPQAKVSASYLGPMLAKRRALAEGFDEVVLLDGEGRVAEAPTANVFVARGGRLQTPPLDRVLSGITRDSVLALARAEGIPVDEVHLSPEQLEGADEAFLTATSMPVVPIAAVGERALLRDAATPGPITARIRELVLSCEHGRDPRFARWVVDVR